jgi:hypothetical protein
MKNMCVKGVMESWHLPQKTLMCTLCSQIMIPIYHVKRTSPKSSRSRPILTPLCFCTKHCEINSFTIRYIFFGLHVILCFKEVVLQHTRLHKCTYAFFSFASCYQPHHRIKLQRMLWEGLAGVLFRGVLILNKSKLCRLMCICRCQATLSCCVAMCALVSLLILGLPF